jgi:hypothetical protein
LDELRATRVRHEYQTNNGAKRNRPESTEDVCFGKIAFYDKWQPKAAMGA